MLWPPVLAIALALFLGCLPCAAGAFVLGSDPRVNPTRFVVTEWASGLDYPTSMAPLDDGSLLVLTNDPTGGDLFDSTAAVVRLVDADDDGFADGPPQVLFGGLPGAATSLRRMDDLVAVVGTDGDSKRIFFLRLGATPASALTLEGEIELQFPTGVSWNHRTVALGVRGTPGQPGLFDLFFNIGSATDNDPTTDTAVGAGLLAGLPGAAAMAGDALFKVTVEDTGGTPTLTNLEQLAAGLRNAAGIAADPGDGSLYFQDNGMDSDPASADELNVLAPAAIGGATEDFGFPTDYIEKGTGTVVGGTAVQPLVAFLPLASEKSEGPFEIAFPPPGFPSSLQGGLFVAFHGRFNSGGTANDENPLVWVDPATGEYFHFIPNGQVDVGHLDGLLAVGDSLYVSDLASSGKILTQTTSGKLYRIRAAPPVIPVPGVSLLVGGAALMVLGVSASLRASASRRHRRPGGRRSCAVPAARPHSRAAS